MVEDPDFAENEIFFVRNNEQLLSIHLKGKQIWPTN
jgi:hypothetical protein